jgi:hypothetical protein
MVENFKEFEMMADQILYWIEKEHGADFAMREIAASSGKNLDDVVKVGRSAFTLFFIYVNLNNKGYKHKNIIEMMSISYGIDENEMDHMISKGAEYIKTDIPNVNIPTKLKKRLRKSRKNLYFWIFGTILIYIGIVIISLTIISPNFKISDPILFSLGIIILINGIILFPIMPLAPRK